MDRDLKLEGGGGLLALPAILPSAIFFSFFAKNKGACPPAPPLDPPLGLHFEIQILYAKLV